MHAAIKSCEETCGKRPLGWYCRYGPSVNTRELFVEEGGFVYDADSYNDDLPYYVDVAGKQHLIVPYTLTYNDAGCVIPQGYGSPGDFFDLLKRGFDYLWDEGETHPRMMSIGLHPRRSDKRDGFRRSPISSITYKRKAAPGSLLASRSPTGGMNTTRNSDPA